MKKSILATVLAVALALAGVGIMPAQAKTADTGTVKVTVKTESGAPIPDADVNFTPVEVDNPTWEFEQWASGHTDKSGVFQTGELASGTYDVSVYAGQLGELNKQITVTKNKDSAESITAKGIQVLKGKVTAKGKPVSKGYVTAYSKSNNYSAEVVNGSYKMLVKAGTYTINAYPTGSSTSWLSTYSGDTVRSPDAKTKKVVAGKDLTVNIKAYDKVGKISGKVTDSKGKPVKGASVSVRANNRAGSGWAETDKNGKYTITGLPADSYQVDAYTDGSAWVSKTAKVSVGKTAKANLKLKKIVKHKGKIVLTLKAPKALVKAGQACASVNSSTGVWYGYSACLNNDGSNKTITFENLPAGKYKVALNGANSAKSVTVKKDKTAKVSMTRAAGSTISGTVKDYKGKALKNATVRATDENGTAVYSVSTDAKGKYKIPGVGKGKYVVSVNGPDAHKNGVATSKNATGKGKKLTVNMKLIKPATIKGKVVNSKGKGVEGVRVDAYGAGYGSATTNAKGEYKLLAVEAGSYAVQARDPYVGGYFNGKSSTKKVATGKTVTFSTIKVKS